MYCRTCGYLVGEASKFCPSCGAQQDTTDLPRGGIATPWIILALVLIPPLGLALMFTSSRWSDNTRWLIGGFFFAPLWTRFLWQRSWSQSIKIAILGVLTLAYLGTIWVWTGFTAALLLTILTLVAVVAIVRSKGAQPVTRRGSVNESELRATVRDKLDSCHNLIAEIEQHTVFDFFPMTSPARQQYLHALDLRSQAMDDFEHARSTSDLVRADARASNALIEMKNAQDALWADAPTGDALPPP